jgi:23S rRNA pseudouridine955/2504/2580 synthase
VPKPRQGRISTFLAKEEREEDSFMRIAQHGEEGASHAVTYYAVVETSAQDARLGVAQAGDRAHASAARAHGPYRHPIVGDPKYFQIENWELPGGMQNRLHLLARRIVVPHPRGGTIDAPRRCRRTCSRAGTCSASMRRATTRSSRRRRNDQDVMRTACRRRGEA